jgi:hypothetical protein
MIKNITLNWHNPIAIQQIKQESIALKNGIYQISKKDKSEELLYIGLVKGETRNFYQRIQEHLQDKDELNNINIYVRFGIFDEKIIDDEIEEIEGALIFDSIPSLNKSKLSQYSKNNDYYIVNKGNNGLLQDVIDTRTHYMLLEDNSFTVKKYDNYENAINNFINFLEEGNVLQLYTFATEAPFLCFMIKGKKTLWFKTSGGAFRYTTFKNLHRYFNQEQVKDERIYIEAIGKYLENILNSK